MNCPNCMSPATETTDTRRIGMIVRRCRRCEACLAEWATTERMDEGSLQVATGSSPSLPVAKPGGGYGGSGSGSASGLGSESGLSKQTRGKRELHEPAGFLEFWAAYPNKVGKAAARRAWLRQKPPLDKCLATLKWQSQSDDWTKEDGDYIPHPATWINAGRWEDQPRPRVVKVTNGKEAW